MSTPDDQATPEPEVPAPPVSYADPKIVGYVEKSANPGGMETR